MIYTPTITQEQAYTALGDFIVASTGLTPIRGQTNRVPTPSGPNWCVMQAGRRQMMATTAHELAPPVAPIPALGSDTIGRSTALYFQVDIYGPAAADNAQGFTTLFRDDWGAAFLASYHLAPLTVDDPRQMPLIMGEQQFIQRWMIEVALHGNIALAVPQGFADRLITTLSEI